MREALFEHRQGLSSWSKSRLSGTVWAMRCLIPPHFVAEGNRVAMLDPKIVDWWSSSRSFATHPKAAQRLQAPGDSAYHMTCEGKSLKPHQINGGDQPYLRPKQGASHCSFEIALAATRICSLVGPYASSYLCETRHRQFCVPLTDESLLSYWHKSFEVPPARSFKPTSPIQS